ncbi:MAG: ATP-binding cassette domain-containing protein, partial [Candidatus Acidiferrales bacterium]
MIRLIDVEKFYESGAGKTWVLRRINLEIREGDFITVMGPSGAGKSTLMGIIGMLDGAWKGEYHLFDNAVHKLDNRRRVELHKKYIGFVFQQYHLLDNLTVAENLDLPLSYRDIKKVEREGMVADILDRFQIVGKKSLFPNQLSGGQQQIVAVARAV